MSKMSGPKSLGKMEVWEPPDKTFSKHTFCDGSGDTTPNEGSLCIVSLLRLPETEIDESELSGYCLDNEPREVTIGEGDTILSGLIDQVVCSMKEGEQAYIKSKVDSQGNKLNELDLGKKCFKFNVTLKSFSRAADQDELEQDELLERAQHHKNKGTELFQKSNLEFAVKRYQKAVDYLSAMDDVNLNLPQSLLDQFKTLRVQCYLNLAACFLKKEDYKTVVENCSKGLKLDPTNVKGLFRRGQANLKLCQYDPAKEDFAAALKLEPDNKAVAKELRNVDEQIKKEKQMYQKMFN